MQIQNCLENQDEFKSVEEITGFSCRYLKIKNLNHVSNNLPELILLRVYELLDLNYNFEMLYTTNHHQIEMLSRIKHDGVVKIYSTGRYDGFAVEVLDNVDGISLREYIDSERPLGSEESDNEAKKIILEIIDAVIAINSVKLARGCIDPEDIIIDENGRAKVLDPSISSVIPAKPSKHKYPTSYYTNMKREYGPMLGYRYSDEVVDVFTYATIFHELLTGKKPFDESSIKINKNYEKIIYAALRSKIENLSDLRNAISTGQYSKLKAAKTKIKVTYNKLLHTLSHIRKYGI